MSKLSRNMALVTLLGPLWQIECHQGNLCDCIIIDSEFQKYSTIIGWVRASKRFIIYIYGFRVVPLLSEFGNLTNGIDIMKNLNKSLVTSKKIYIGFF